MTPARSTVLWTVLAAIALLWPARMLGALDGIPLDGRWDAIVIGVAVPALWWLDRGFLRRRFAQTLIVSLLAWKALLAIATVPHGLCAKFTTDAPLVGNIQTIPIEEPRGVLRSWDVRADWRAADPACTAIVDRSYDDGTAFPAWFVNLIDFIRPGNRQITLDVTGYVRARESGLFALQVGRDMSIEGSMDGAPLAMTSDRGEVRLAPGIHHLVARSKMTGQAWELKPLWNGRAAWGDVELATAPPSSVDRILWPVAATVTVVLVLLLVSGWSVSALSGFDRAVLAWSAAATLAAMALAASDRLDRLGGALLLGAVLVPVSRSARRVSTAFVLLGIPWLAFFAAHEAARIGHLTAYSADDWLTYQVAGYRIFMNGFWLEGGNRVFDYQPLYRWITGALHLVFGDSSVGEVYWDAGCVLAGALLCVQLVKPAAGFAMAILAGALMLATFTLGTPWYFVGRGLSEIAAAGWAFLAASFLLRARLGRRSAALAAGVCAVLMFYTRLNHLLFAGFLLALLWPARTRARVADIRRAFAAVSGRAAALYAACFAAGLVLFAARTWYYTGVFSLFYGTSLKNNDTGLRLTTLGSLPVWKQVGHSLKALVWMNEPPGFDPRALVVFAGSALAVLALLQVPRLNRLPFRVAAAGVGAMIGSAFVHTHNYPGRMSIHLMPFAVAMSVMGIAAVLPARLQSWQPGDRLRRRGGEAAAADADPEAARLARRTRRVFGAVAAALALLLTCAGLLATDIYLHRKYERSGGFNVWGYRGPVVGRKQPGEYRVAVLGGSTAYGYGVEWNEAIPALLEQQLAQHGGGGRYSVVNLGYNNEGAYSFTFTLKDYESLRYDLACLYEGYNDMIGDPRLTNLSVFRHDSPIFRLTGYLPIFPIIFKEKAASMLNGDPGAVYHPEKRTVFHPGLAKRATADVLATAAAVSESLERQLDRAVAEPPRHISDAASSGCKDPWADYCHSMSSAIEYVLARNHQVMVVTQPYRSGSLRERHMDQQRELAAMLERRFAGDRRVRYVNLGEAVDLGNPELSFDGMHLTAAGNKPVAAALVAPVMEMAARRDVAALGKDARP